MISQLGHIPVERCVPEATLTVEGGVLRSLVLDISKSADRTIAPDAVFIIPG